MIDTPLFSELPPFKKDVIEDKLKKIDVMNFGMRRNQARSTGIYRYRRREAKALSRQEEILKCYFEDNMKPSNIRKELKVSVDFVYKTVYNFKRLA